MKTKFILITDVEGDDWWINMDHIICISKRLRINGLYGIKLIDSDVIITITNQEYDHLLDQIDYENENA